MAEVQSNITIGQSNTFVGLLDAPNTYIGQAGKTVVVNATEDGLEFGTGGGGSSIYTADDTIGSGRTATLTDSLTFAGTNANQVYFGVGTYIKTTEVGYSSYAIYVGQGTVACQSNGAFQILSYNSQLAKNYLSLYAGKTILTGTSAGLATISQTTSPTYNIGARFGIVGLGSTSATTNLRLEDSAGNRQLQMYDSGSLVLETQSSTGSNLSFYSAGGGSLIATFQKTSSTGLSLNMRASGTTFFYTREAYTAFPYWGGTWRGVKIGGATAPPAISAALELDSTVKGFLQPRMTGAEVEAIGTPATGLQAYATNAGSGDVTGAGWWGYDGTNWVQGFSGGGGSSIYTADGTIGSGRVATITDTPTFQGNQANPIGLKIENQSSGATHLLCGVKLQLTSNADTGYIGQFDSVGGGTGAPTMIIESPTGINYKAGSAYVNGYHYFQTDNAVGFAINRDTNSAILRSILAGGGGNYTELQLAYTGGDYNFIKTHATSGGKFIFGRENGGSFEYMRIAQDGEVGINQAVPTAQLNVKGSGSTSATSSLLIENSSSETYFQLRDDKYCIITGNNGVNNFFNLKNEATWTLLDAGDKGSNVGRVQIKASNNNRFIFEADLGLAVGDAGAITNEASSVLTATSTTKGFLPPRMTTAQMNAIGSPAEGLLLWDTDTNDLKGYDGDNWVYLGGKLEQIYGIYTFDLEGDTDNLGDSGVDTVPVITNAIHNVTNIYRVDPDSANHFIKGILAPPTGVNRVLHISNVSNTDDIKFDHDNSSTPENGIMLRDGADKAIKGNETASFWYDHLEVADGTLPVGRWKVFNRVG